MPEVPTPGFCDVFKCPLPGIIDRYNSALATEELHRQQKEYEKAAGAKTVADNILNRYVLPFKYAHGERYKDCLLLKSF